jgi:ribonuclease P/MRP protein subunit RPP40
MQFRDRHFFVRLYTQYVRPHLEFALPAWSPWSLSDKECLERVQRRAIRMVSGISGNSYEERLKELGLTNLKERRHRLDMIQTYKIVRGHEYKGIHGSKKQVIARGQFDRQQALTT